MCIWSRSWRGGQHTAIEPLGRATVMEDIKPIKTDGWRAGMLKKNASLSPRPNEMSMVVRAKAASPVLHAASCRQPSRSQFLSVFKTVSHGLTTPTLLALPQSHTIVNLRLQPLTNHSSSNKVRQDALLTTLLTYTLLEVDSLRSFHHTRHQPRTRL